MHQSNSKVMAATFWGTFAGSLRNGLAGFGLLALGVLAVDGAWHFASAPALRHVPSLEVIRSAEAAPAPQSIAREDVRHRVLATHLSRKYYVSVDAMEKLVAQAFEVGHQTGLEPTLILAVMAVESRFNPIAESDYGAKGLMQVVPRFHLDKLAYHGGESVVLEPHVNILVGAQILKEYVQRAGGLTAGLQMYAGAIDDPATGYAQKVMAEKQRLEQALRRHPAQAPTA